MRGSGVLGKGFRSLAAQIEYALPLSTVQGKKNDHAVVCFVC